MPLEIAGARLFALFANGLLEAGRASEGRYKFDDVPLNIYETDDWRMSRALAAADSLRTGGHGLLQRRSR